MVLVLSTPLVVSQEHPDYCSFSGAVAVIYDLLALETQMTQSAPLVSLWSLCIQDPDSHLIVLVALYQLFQTLGLAVRSRSPRAAFVVSDRVRTVALQDELPLKFKYQSVNIHASGYKCEWQR